jgi:hypothetical protein
MQLSGILKAKKNPFVKFIIVILIVSACSMRAWSQTVAINGMVADSATLRPLAYVNLQVKSYLRGTFTNDKGYFSISVSEADTIIFSIIGYKSKVLPVKKIASSSIIYLSELNSLLREITVSPHGPFDMPKIPPTHSWNDATTRKDRYPSPFDRQLQTFGPSFVFKGVFSRFSKFVKERKRLPDVQAENKRAMSFIALVRDSSFVTEFTAIYNITQDEYRNVLRLFNEKYGTEVYKLRQDELISLLHIFYSAYKRKNGTK